MQPHLILFVGEQAVSARFYESVLGVAPTLDVPGMTEFKLGDGCTLGLMPRSGAQRLLADSAASIEFPSSGARHELYVYVDEPEAYLRRALSAGATLASEFQPRSWGDEASYCLDLDGHLLCFARRAYREHLPEQPPPSATD